MKTLCTACVTFGLTFGCTSEPAAPVGALVVDEAAATAAAPADPMAATNTSRATAPSESQRQGACDPGLQGLTDAGGWVGSDQDGWNGTGHEDPENLRKISNEDMLAMAQNAGDPTQRWIALVSVGRRKVPGAIAAFKSALSASNAVETREMAMNGMMEHGGPEVLQMFWDILEDDPSAQLRGKAIWGIASYTPSDAERAIRLGLQDKEGEVVGMAILATWSLYKRPEVAIPILEAAANHKEKYAWQEAAQVLSRMPYSDAANILDRTARASSHDEDKQRSFVWGYRQWLRAFPDLCK